MENENSGVEGFYTKCAELLGATHAYKKFPYRKRTRWNNRTAGNGRFIGHGLVRVFGPTTIHVSLTSPRLSGCFKSQDAVLEAIKQAMA